MTINTDLMYEVLLEATAFPEVHDQTEWAEARLGSGPNCGTAYCMAGLSVALTNEYDFRWGDFELDPEMEEGEIDCYDRVYVRDNETGADYSIDSLAQKLLGLDYYQADEMFESDNSIKRLWELAERYTNGAVTRPEQSVIDEYRLMGSRIKKIDAPYFTEQKP